MIGKQQQISGDVLVTTVLFDDECYLIHDRFDINKVKPLTRNEYFAGGTTALLDAIGITIDRIMHARKNEVEANWPNKTLMVIITDGMENASREYDYQDIKGKIERQKKNHEWEFIFLGANIDSFETARQFGIAKEMAANFHADAEGTQLNFATINEAVSSIREKHSIDANWKARIDSDFKKRKK